MSTIKRTGGIVSRWFQFLNTTNPWIEDVVLYLNASLCKKKVADSAAGVSYEIGLDAKAITRFSLEPSGYLHIRHAKAALLNDYLAHNGPGGTLICRFDDTHPSKEKLEFQDCILHDLSLIGVVPDKISYSSDYFGLMYDLCIELIAGGNAYADDTDKETMDIQQRDGLPSRNRDMSPEETLSHFGEMKSGTPEGIKWCIRAKISVDDRNKAMRDPVIYRCNLNDPHHRTGTTWKIYPTCDFSAPILDSVERVTLALRTDGYHDRNAQYAWIQKALSLPETEIRDSSPMGFGLSKQKLTLLVDKGLVRGWDDPRMPTIRGLRRRGLTVEALREFVLKQEPTGNVLQDWSSLWAINKKIIDPLSPCFTAIKKTGMVTATIHGFLDSSSSDKPRHDKNPALGTKKVAHGRKLYLEKQDAEPLKIGQEITLVNWGNAKVHGFTKYVHKALESLHLVLHLDDDVEKAEKKITWLAKDQGLVPVHFVDFDHLVTKDKIEEEDDVSDWINLEAESRSEAWADCNVADLKEGEIVQFERKGYYRLDRPLRDGEPAVFIAIPNGEKA